MRVLIHWWERHQALLYLLAIAGGAALGLMSPPAVPVMQELIEPSLMLLLFSTFMAVPLAEAGKGFRDLRFLGTVLGVNFAVMPLAAWGLSRFVMDDQGLLLGVLLVLLTPCIDYVIVFTGLAGGAQARLLAATPLLMLVQILLLPLYLWLFAGSQALAAIQIAPFIRAFILLIIIPLAAAALVQLLGRKTRAGQAIGETMGAAMVPLMMGTLAAVVGSQIPTVATQLASLARVVPLYLIFAVIAVLVGSGAGKAAGLDAGATRAVMFSATTRNSLVVLPMALALPATFALAPMAVVTQTLVELVIMVVMIRLVPRLARET
ncbi:arsenic resistance protein [Glutamicibacter sp. JL.03c]|uniref:arsenic resistance protein n=1 Tax=Glutamicibacter sp. JL.03c TaxID=2984842 RepID=UPI0021F7DF47|nr:bile acid:sodium symporter [Glutamicibacter sp. JL.03c]UYQ77265.1 arsenic resistance protein [Glutamicibacter sp. JL.03c]